MNFRKHFPKIHSENRIQNLYFKRYFLKCIFEKCFPKYKIYFLEKTLRNTFLETIFHNVNLYFQKKTFQKKIKKFFPKINNKDISILSRS